MVDFRDTLLAELRQGLTVFDEHLDDSDPDYQAIEGAMFTGAACIEQDGKTIADLRGILDADPDESILAVARDITTRWKEATAECDRLREALERFAYGGNWSASSTRLRWTVTPERLADLRAAVAALASPSRSPSTPAERGLFPGPFHSPGYWVVDERGNARQIDPPNGLNKYAALEAALGPAPAESKPV